MTRLQAISRFSPGNCDPAFLESITVGREDLLRGLEKAVSSSVRSGAGHHSLIVGPRGAGKTHLVALLRDRVQRNEKLRKRVVIAYLKEEERGVAHFLDWLVRILQSFVRHEEAGPALAREIEQLMDMEHEAAQAAAEQLLVRFVGKRRLLLLVENLGEIFSSKKGMGREGQQRFRDLVQQHPFWTIVATTQALFDDVQTRDAPFYGFFKIQHVQPLTFEEAASLLERLAEVEQRPKLHAFLKTAPARGRIRAVHSLTRGSPRLLVIFYQFIDSDSVEELSSSFLGMVDSLTSYYQERMNLLSAGQQKIVEALCSQRTPMTVKQIARSCFISPSSASSELKRLADMRYVTSQRAGRESYYEISEPLFRICFEVKENRGYPVRLFVDFLGVFYTAEELDRKYRGAYFLSILYKNQGLSAEERRERDRLLHLEQAALVHHEINLRQQPGDSEGVEIDLGKIYALAYDLVLSADYREIARLADAVVALQGNDKMALLLSANAHRVLGDREVASRRVDELARLLPDDVNTWIEKALLDLMKGDVASAEASYRRALDILPDHVDALVGLGYLLLERAFPKDIMRIPEKTKKVLERIGAGDIWDPSTIQESLRDPFEITAKVEAARDLFERAHAKDPEALSPLVALGEVLLFLGREAESLRFAQQACRIAPGDPTCWYLRGRVAHSLGDDPLASESLQRATVLQPEHAGAWLVLADTQERLSELDAALTSARHATNFAPENVFAWLCRARLALKQNSFDEARRCYAEAAATEGLRSTVYTEVAMRYFENRQFERGLAILEDIAKQGSTIDETTASFRVWSVFGPLLVHEQLGLLPRYFQGHHAAFVASGQLRNFTLGVSSVIQFLLKRHIDKPVEPLQAIAGQVLPELERYESLVVIGRLFSTGVRYLSEKDERILLELPLEERNVLRAMLSPPNPEPRSTV
jgi:tetratricopeptide (TPR) repeat protein